MSASEVQPTVDRVIKELRSFCISAGSNPMTVGQLAKDYRTLLCEDVNEVLRGIGFSGLMEFLRSEKVVGSLHLQYDRHTGVTEVKANSTPDTAHIERLVARQKQRGLSQFTTPTQPAKQPQTPKLRPRKKPANLQSLVALPVSYHQDNPEPNEAEPLQVTTTVQAETAGVVETTKPSLTTVKRTKELVEVHNWGVKASDFRRLFDQKYTDEPLDLGDLSVRTFFSQFADDNQDEVELILMKKRKGKSQPDTNRSTSAWSPSEAAAIQQSRPKRPRVIYNSSINPSQFEPFRRQPNPHQLANPSCLHHIRPFPLLCLPPCPTTWGFFPLSFPPFPVFPPPCRRAPQSPERTPTPLIDEESSPQHHYSQLQRLGLRQE